MSQHDQVVEQMSWPHEVHRLWLALLPEAADCGLLASLVLGRMSAVKYLPAIQTAMVAGVVRAKPILV